MKIEMSTKQFKKKVLAITDKFDYYNDKHKRIMSYLDKEDIRKKAHSYNKRTGDRVLDWFHNLSDQQILDMCFDKTTERVIKETGWLWWHKSEEVYQDRYELKKDLSDTGLEELFSGNFTPERAFSDVKSVEGYDFYPLKKVKVNPINCRIYPPELNSSVKNCLDKVKLLEQEGIESIVLEDSEIKMLSQPVEDFITKSYYVEWFGFNVHKIYDYKEQIAKTISVIEDKPFEEVLEFLENI